jgi:formylglycine-generating enzyme required for sulfatase activity
MRMLTVMAVMVTMACTSCGKDDTTKPTPTGACCAPAGTCMVTTQSGCNGTWTQTGVCDPNPCRQPPLGMVLIPAGTFNMGSPASEPGRSDSETMHQVTLTHSLYVSKHEVTQGEWQSVMGWNDSYFRGAIRPVERVTWFDCIAYCNRRSAAEGLDSIYVMTGRRLDGVNIYEADSVACDWAKSGYRLLTEAEWEYTCRAGNPMAFCNGPITNVGSACGDDPGLDYVGWYCGNSGHESHDTGGRAPNYWGLYDMHGNVMEWCWDLYGSYPSGPIWDPLGAASGSDRVLRGGSWGGEAFDCRSARRSGVAPGGHSIDLGLRVARAAQ